MLMLILACSPTIESPQDSKPPLPFPSTPSPSILPTTPSASDDLYCEFEKKSGIGFAKKDKTIPKNLLTALYLKICANIVS